MNACTSQCASSIELNYTQHKDLVARAKGVLVFPKITKGGVGVGGQFGEGALRIDGKNVDYYSISSASVGLTLGTPPSTKKSSYS